MRKLLWSGGIAVLLAGLSLLIAASAEPQNEQGGTKSRSDASPSIERHLVEGRIGCSFGAWSVSTEDLCAEAGLTAGTSTSVVLAPGRRFTDVTAAYFRLTWTSVQPGPAGDHLTLRYPFPTSNETSLETSGTPQFGQVVVGTSPLHVRLGTPEDHIYEFGADADMNFEVRSPGTTHENLLDSGLLVFDQPFELCVVLAYNRATLGAAPCGP